MNRYIKRIYVQIIKKNFVIIQVGTGTLIHSCKDKALQDMTDHSLLTLQIS